MTCDAHIRPFPGVTIACESGDDHDGMHSGTLRDYG